MSRFFCPRLTIPFVGLALAAVALLAALPAQASPSEILMVRFIPVSSGWGVDVTIRHADTGWDHYTNVWVVETMDGKQLGKRVLFHPHVGEQPFTRSDTVRVPKGVTKVRIRAGDNVDGISSNVVVVDLTKKQGDRFQVNR